MTLTTRRLVAVIVAVVTLIIAAAWLLYAGNALYWYAWANLAQNVPLSQAGGPRPDAWDQGAHPYYLISSAALLLATGGSAALLILLPRPSFRHRAWIYLFFLSIILPATWYNYGQKDVVLRASLQAGLNCIVIFLSATTALWLSSAPASAPDAKVLKYLSLTLLLLAGVFVPGIFSVIWLFYAAGLITEEQSRQITFAHITGLASVASALIAWLNYSRDRRSDEAEKSAILIVK